MKHPKKKLTASISLNSISLSNNPSKDSKVKTTNSTPPLPSDAQDLVYARISKSKLHLKSSKVSKNHQPGPLPDFVTLPEHISNVLEEEDRLILAQLPVHAKFKDYECDTVYSEVKNYDDYEGQNEPVDNVEGCAYFYDSPLPSLPICPDLKNRGEDEQLDIPMEQLAIHRTPNVYGAESMYSQVMDHYDDYVGNEESVDNVGDREYFYPPFACDTQFETLAPSNFGDSQDEGFSTYDNLPKRL